MQPQVNPPPKNATPPPVLSGGASQDIEDFIYLISHDVRSSVRALLELPQWIAEDLEDAGIPVEGHVATSIDMMNRHMGRLDRMLVDLLTFSRAGRMQEVVRIDLSAALDEVLEEMKVPKGFQVVRDFDCPTAWVGERDILTLLGALVRNAIKHHDQPKGHIIVATQMRGDEVVLQVTDDGPGIAAEHRERVFGAMRTLKPRDEVEGSGMGLATVRKIASLYGGHAVMKASPLGRGSMVEVRLAAKPVLC